MWFNPIMKWLITSPFHFFVSNNTMIITYTGRKSGNTYTTPVNYVKNGDLYYTTSLRDRVWWRNLRNGSAVQLFVKRNIINAIPTVVEKENQVADHLRSYFQLAPRLARYYKITLDKNGIPLKGDLKRSAETMIMVVFKVIE